MNSISTKILFDGCYGKYGIAAVNVFTMEQVLGVFSAASYASSPVIIQTTTVARNYAHPKMLLGMISAASDIYPNVVYSIHLDHGNEDHINEILQGEEYSSVMIDASHEKFETNIKRTKAVVATAHKKELQVEAELGVLSGVEDDLNVDSSKARYTDPEQAQEFVERTRCDSLAVAVGTSHGAYKFQGEQGLNFDVLNKIHVRLPEFPLVLHGASHIDKDIIKRINLLGGRLREDSHGVQDDQLKQAISLGVCKINMATDFRLLWTKIHREFFVNEPDRFDPIIPGGRYMEAFKEFMLTRFDILGSTGKSKGIRNKV